MIDKNELALLADKYNTKDFIKSDPIQFPRRLYDQGARLEDVEISAIISSWLAYGSRSVFFQVIGGLHQIMGWNPYEFIRNRAYKSFRDGKSTLYRFYAYDDFYRLCENLHIYYFSMYKGYAIGDVLLRVDDPFKKLIDMFDNIKGFPTCNKSACKRLNMLLRWMVRNDGIVDMGVWGLDKSKLVIPLDTHVHRMALKLGITKRKQADMETAIEITDYFKAIFPDDPAKGDFALYGLRIDNNKQ